jgi:hypothetical protein
MAALLPGPKVFRTRDQKGKITGTWIQPELNWKTKVVCDKCNNEWMSNIESQHAKSAMTDLILGKKGVEISHTRAHSIALFAFKTAVLFDHIRRESPPFFTRSARFLFRERLEIPCTVRMWMAAVERPGNGSAITWYQTGHLNTDNTVELYACTFSCQHFCFQVVAERRPSSVALIPCDRFEQLAVPFWPAIARNFVWPAPSALRSVEEFQTFSARWKKLDAFFFTGMK